MTYLKKRLDDKLLIFALDSQYEDEPMIDILKTRYSVSIYPTLIIGDVKYEGYTAKDDILNEICAHYNGDIEDCIPFKYQNSTSP